MNLKRNRIIKNRKGCGIETQVGSIRAEKEFWDNCDIVSKLENTSRNELIVRAVAKYCKKILDKQKII